MSGDTFNFNATAHSGGTVVQGQTASANVVNNFGGAIPPDPIDVLAKIREVLSAPDDSPSPIVNPYAQPGVPDPYGPPAVAPPMLGAPMPADLIPGVMEPLQDLAALPPDQQATTENKAKAESLWARLKPYAPKIAKAMLAFGSASLTALASTHPAMAGLLAVCKLAESFATPTDPVHN